MAYQIRHIRDSDWDSIVRLEAAAYGDCGLSEERTALESRGQAGPATSFVLDTGTAIAGYLLALPYPRLRCPDLARAERFFYDSPNLHLHDLVIIPELRGKGLARRLLHHLGETARSKAYERISLIAVAGSRSFWSANGYRPHPEVEVPGGYGANAVYMSKALSKGEADGPCPQ
jgi:ornithine decarboxylase